MNKEQLNKANKLESERRDIEKEIKVWDHKLSTKCRLGYKWEGDHFTKLSTSISDGLFTSFRVAALNELKLRLAEIDNAFRNL